MNLIHINDIINIMHHFCLTQSISDIINVTCNTQPTRAEYYTYLSQLFSKKTPLFDDQIDAFKLVSNKKLTDEYNLPLSYPSPLTFTFDHVS